VESLIFIFDAIAILIVIYMGVRDDRRSPGTPQKSLFRTFDPDPKTSRNRTMQRRYRTVRSRIK
jgi:hypothetical protein